MIDPETFISVLREANVDFYAGVPDSLMSSFSAVLDEKKFPGKHIITACEGGAVSAAMGYHLATGKYGLVYMQNSGLGNALNPLVSLAHREIYGVPMILLIGWRGEPDQVDEPQHIKQGAITLAQLDLLDIPYLVMDSQSDFRQIVRDTILSMEQNPLPSAIVVKKGTFSAFSAAAEGAGLSKYGREQAIGDILDICEDNALVVSTTGKISREVYECREARNMICEDFLTVGGMGFASSIALGVALGNEDRRVICIDGDGALLMQMGGVPIIGSQKPQKFIHFILNNAMHESVGGQPTVAGEIDILQFGIASGYSSAERISSFEELQEAYSKAAAKDGTHMIEVRIKGGARENLGRPKSSPIQNKDAFMKKAASLVS